MWTHNLGGFFYLLRINHEIVPILLFLNRCVYRPWAPFNFKCIMYNADLQTRFFLDDVTAYSVVSKSSEYLWKRN